MWLNQNFLLPDEIEGKDTDLDIMFLSLRTGNPLAIKMDPSGNVRLCLFPLMGHLHDDVIYYYKCSRILQGFAFLCKLGILLFKPR